MPADRDLITQLPVDEGSLTRHPFPRPVRFHFLSQ